MKREFWKNREGSIGKALREFEKSAGLGSVPRLVREHSEFKQLTELVGAAERKKAEIIAHVRDEVTKEATAADKEVRRLFALSEEIHTSGEIFTEAYERALRRLPPGKHDALGDRLAWVALLKAVPAKAELHIISVDGDFASEMNQNEIKPYLQSEWQTKKQGTVKLWKRASQFLAARIPGAISAIEIERTLMVESLEGSANFVTTHALVAEFSDLSHLSPSLVERLGNAILNNSQIRRLRGDEDVKKFISEFLANYRNQLATSVKDELEKLLKERW
jgi:hypothetical protein